MRLPRPCPELDYKALGRLLNDKPDLVEAHAGPLPQGSYLHWDDLRHRTPPDGLSHEEWWVGVAFARTTLRKLLPVRRKNGETFHYSQVDPIIEMTSNIDRRASGQIAMSVPLTQSETRDQYVLSSLIEEAITSSQLEGAATTSKVAKDMLRTGRKPATKGEKMILNNFKAMEFVKGLRDQPITSDHLFTLHRIVTEDTLEDPTAAGRFRREDEEIYVRDEEDQVLHVPPPAAELSERFASMIEFANGSTTPESVYMHPVVRAITLHFWLAYDHPFVDGNGRTARALFYWSMLRQEYWLAEFISISSILRKAPARYGRSYLLSESSNGDATYFLLYQLDVLRRSIDALDAWLKRKVREQRQTEGLLRSLRMLNHRQVALITHAAKHPQAEYTIKWHQKSHRVVYQTARRDLLELEELGLLHRVQRGNTFYFSPVSEFDARLEAIGRGEAEPGQGRLFSKDSS